MRIAIIDLGTNTCNLLIAEVNGFDFTILHQSKQLVKLGDDKIRENEISPEATQRTINSFLKHKKIISRFEVDQVETIATSAVRSAENKDHFLKELSDSTGLKIRIVSGEKEADLIFKGVLLAFEKINQPSAILDIGGGSNELILTEGSNLLWKESQPTGMARIIGEFQVSDPIKPEEIEVIQQHFLSVHKHAFHKCSEKSVKTLIGCSGAFDTIADIIDKVDPGIKQRTTQAISIEEFYNVHAALIQSTKKQRLQMKGMDMVRVDLIVPAMILIELLVANLNLKQIIQTDFALREGALYEIINRV